MKAHALIASLVLVSMAIYPADTTPNNKIDSKATFARLQTLAGEWQADTSMGKAHVTYELIAGGSALVERDTSEHMPPMVTVYHLDGDRLLLTHYCMEGNQPRMQARSFDPKTGELRFQFLDATNLASSNAGHMHNATFRFVDDQHMTAGWEFYKGGQRTSTTTFQLTRVR